MILIKGIIFLSGIVFLIFLATIYQNLWIFYALAFIYWAEKLGEEK